MSAIEPFIWIVNLIGTVAFAASGALTGLKKGMDLFGVCILGLVTAVGGGVIRDLILGLTPPMAFQDPTSALVALAVSAVFFLGRVRRLLMYKPALFNHLLFWMDALGLGVFTVVGVQIAYEAVAEPTLFLLVFVAVVTGVGGGVLRDQLAGIPRTSSSSMSTPPPLWPGRFCAPGCGPGWGAWPPCSWD